ncbi:MAG: hypothetical protein GEU82_17115 [Luteitalea sp.]|nr:hypothetical protein [Luteitalea sp.]
MSRLQWIVSGVRNGFRRHAQEREMEAELTFHLDARVDDLIAKGRLPTDAMRQARLEFGSRGAHEEGCRDARGFPLLEHLLSDVRYAARGLVRSRRLVCVAVFSLGIGVGVNTRSSALSRRSSDGAHRPCARAARVDWGRPW